MKTYAILALVLGIFVVGCSSEKKESLADERKALQGGPMPPGTWEKIAAQRKAFEATHGPAASGTPTGPTGG